MKRTFNILLIACFLLASAFSAGAADIWYEDNSFAKPRTLPPDFIYKFEHPEVWSDAMNRLNVYLFRINIFNRANFPEITDEFIVKSMLPLLKKNNIKIGFDVAGAMLSGCVDRTELITNEFKWASRFKDVGGEVAYLTMQSILTKRRIGNMIVPECSLEERVKGSIEYAKQFLQIYPNAEIGIIDDLPSHGRPYKEAYKYTRDAFQAANIPLRYIHLDLPAELVAKGKDGLTWKKVVEVEQYVKKLGLKFGLLCTSRRGGYISDKEFYFITMQGFRDYIRTGGAADDYIIISWFPHPIQTVRRNSQTVGDYPVTDMIIDISKELEKIEKFRQEVETK